MSTRTISNYFRGVTGSPPAGARVDIELAGPVLNEDFAVQQVPGTALTVGNGISAATGYWSVTVYDTETTGQLVRVRESVNGSPVRSSDYSIPVGSSILDLATLTPSEPVAPYTERLTNNSHRLDSSSAHYSHPELQAQIDAIAAGATDPGSEVAQARVGSGPASETYASLKARLDSERTALSFKEFGAVGDGTTDDTAAIQAALDASGNRSLLAEAGLTYKVTDALTMSDGTHLDLRGSILKFVLDGLKEDLLPGSYCIIENGTVWNEGVNPGGSGNYQAPITIGDFMDGTGKEYVILRNLIVKTNKPIGVCVNVFGGSRNILIENINFPPSDHAHAYIEMHWGGQPVDGFADPNNASIQHPNNVTVRNVFCGEMGAATDTGGAAIYLSSVYNILIENVIIDTPYRGFVLSCGDYGDDYSVTSQRGKIGTGIHLNNVRVIDATKSGIGISGYTAYGLIDPNFPNTISGPITCDTTSASAVLTNVLDPNGLLFVGRVITLSGGLGEYQIQGISGTSVTLDRAVGSTTTGTVLTGGGWDFGALITNSSFGCDGSSTVTAPAEFQVVRGLRMFNCRAFGGYSHGISTVGNWVHGCLFDGCDIFDNRHCGISENRAGKANRNTVRNCRIYRCNGAGSTDRTEASGIYFSSTGNVAEGCVIGQPANETICFGLAVNATARDTKLLNNHIAGLDTSLAEGAFKNGHGSDTDYAMKTLAIGNTVASGLTYQVDPGTPMLHRVSQSRWGQRTNVEFASSAAPTSGTWDVGDRVINATPAVGQPRSWACTVAGTPGTWVSEGSLYASGAPTTFADFILTGTTTIDKIEMGTGRSAYNNDTVPSIWQSLNPGGSPSYPYTANGNLILEPRLDGATCDVVMLGAGGVPNAISKGAGGFSLEAGNYEIDGTAVIDSSRMVRLRNYTVVGLPSAVGLDGAVVYVSNEAGGSVPAYSNGTNWLRVTDRAIVS